MSGLTDLAARAVELRSMAARARRLVLVATLSAEDVDRILQYADELDREASGLEDKIAAAP